MCSNIVVAFVMLRTVCISKMLSQESMAPEVVTPHPWLKDPIRAAQ